MAFRGRGRGRGRRQGGDRIAKKVPYTLFPEDVTLPSLPNVDLIPEEEKRLISSKCRLEHFWLGSCYHLYEELFPKLKEKSKCGKGKSSEVFEIKEDVEIERYSDRAKWRIHAEREALESYLKQTPLNFPPKLIQGMRRSQRATKKLHWDRNLGVKEFDVLPKLEEESKDEDGKKAKERESKENESGDEEGEEKKEEDEEYSDDGDYNQNIDFDDDEDDMNMEEEPGKLDKLQELLHSFRSGIPGTALLQPSQ